MVVISSVKQIFLSAPRPFRVHFIDVFDTVEPQ